MSGNSDGVNLRAGLFAILVASVLGGSLMPVHAYTPADPCSQSNHRCGEEPVREDGVKVDHDCQRCLTCAGSMMRFDIQSGCAICPIQSERIPNRHSDPVADALIDAPPHPPRA